MSSNDNDSARMPVSEQSDSHGHAALLLVESLIHGLCENETLSVSEAVAITERAADVQGESAEAADGASASLWRAHAQLRSIKESLSIDQSTPNTLGK